MALSQSIEGAMTVKAASRLAMLLCVTMVPLLVKLGVQSRDHLASMVLPVTVVFMTISVEVRIARELRDSETVRSEPSITALLTHLLFFIPCIALASLLAMLRF